MSCLKPPYWPSQKLRFATQSSLVLWCYARVVTPLWQLLQTGHMDISCIPFLLVGWGHNWNKRNIFTKARSWGVSEFPKMDMAKAVKLCKSPIITLPVKLPKIQSFHGNPCHVVATCAVRSAGAWDALYAAGACSGISCWHRDQIIFVSPIFWARLLLLSLSLESLESAGLDIQTMPWGNFQANLARNNDQLKKMHQKTETIKTTH